MDTAASMARETVELADGRYLIYYTFGALQLVLVPEVQQAPASTPPDQPEQHREENRPHV